MRLLCVAAVAVTAPVAWPAASLAAAGLPVPSLPLPAISGTAAPGQTLTCSAGTWLNVDSQTTYSFSWQRDVTTTLSTGSNQYTVANGDVGHAITCSQTATNPPLVGVPLSATETSAPITGVALPTGGQPIDVVPPTISGNTAPGQTVTCSTGTWLNSPTSYAYSWQRDGASIAGQTTNQYLLASADVGHAITCTVMASNSAGPGLPAISPPILVLSLPVGLVPVETSPPTIQGNAVQGQTVSCLPGAWSNSPTSYAYTWQRTGTDISGATNTNYTLTAGDVNQAITCTVVASNAIGSSVPAISLSLIHI